MNSFLKSLAKSVFPERVYEAFRHVMQLLLERKGAKNIPKALELELFIRNAKRSRYSGAGTIFGFHRIVPDGERSALRQIQDLQVTAGYLERLIYYVRERGYDTIPLGEVPERLGNPDAPPFVSFTFDDGYADNYRLAYPVLKKHGCPFCLFVCPGLTSLKVRAWWLLLYEIVLRNNEVRFSLDGTGRVFATSTLDEKESVFSEISFLLIVEEPSVRDHTIDELCRRYSVDPHSISDPLFASWEEIALLSADPLATIGAHTMTHPSLGQRTDEEVRFELRESRAILEKRLGKKIAHFAYPYGFVAACGPREFALAQEEGFTTAVTTRLANVSHGHRQHLFALPRVTVSGLWQDFSVLDTYLNGYQHAKGCNFALTVTD